MAREITLYRHSSRRSAWSNTYHVSPTDTDRLVAKNRQWTVYPLNGHDFLLSRSRLDPVPERAVASIDETSARSRGARIFNGSPVLAINCFSDHIDGPHLVSWRRLNWPAPLKFYRWLICLAHSLSQYVQRRAPKTVLESLIVMRDYWSGKQNCWAL